MRNVYESELFAKKTFSNPLVSFCKFPKLKTKKYLHYIYINILYICILYILFGCVFFIDECIENFRNTQQTRHFSEHNNQQDCEQEGGQWLELHSFLEKAPSATNQAACDALTTSTGVKHVWKVPYDGWKNNYQEECLVQLKQPDCRAADFSRVNHNGNGVNLEPLSYDWELPYFPSLTPQRCVLRIR